MKLSELREMIDNEIAIFGDTELTRQTACGHHKVIATLLLVPVMVRGEIVATSIVEFTEGGRTIRSDAADLSDEEPIIVNDSPACHEQAGRCSYRRADG